MPTSRSVAVGVFADDSVDATKDSDSMENGGAVHAMGIEWLKKRDRKRAVGSSFSPAASSFFFFRDKSD
jgi:hypothetical protein